MSISVTQDWIGMLVATVLIVSNAFFCSIFSTLSWLMHTVVVNDLLLTSKACLDQGQTVDFHLTSPAIWPSLLSLLPQQQCHCMTGTPMTCPSPVWPGRAVLCGLRWPSGWARLRRAMHELPARVLFAWPCTDSSLQITSLLAAAWALTTLCRVMHYNLQTSLCWDGVGKRKPFLQLNSFPLFWLLSPSSSVLLLFVIVSISSISSYLLFMDMPARASCTATSLLRFSRRYKHPGKGKNIAVLAVNLPVDLMTHFFCSTRV